MSQSHSHICATIRISPIMTRSTIWLVVLLLTITYISSTTDYVAGQNCTSFPPLTSLQTLAGRNDTGYQPCSILSSGGEIADGANCTTGCVSGYYSSHDTDTTFRCKATNWTGTGAICLPTPESSSSSSSTGGDHVGPTDFSDATDILNSLSLVGMVGTSTVNQIRSDFSGILSADVRDTAYRELPYSLTDDPTSQGNNTVQYRIIPGPHGIYTVPDRNGTTPKLYHATPTDDYVSDGGALCYGPDGTTYMAGRLSVYRLPPGVSTEWELVATFNTRATDGSNLYDTPMRRCVVHPNGRGVYFGGGYSFYPAGRGIWFWNGTVNSNSSIVNMVQLGPYSDINSLCLGPNNTVLAGYYGSTLLSFPIDLTGEHNQWDFNRTVTYLTWPHVSFYYGNIVAAYDATNHYLYITARNPTIERLEQQWNGDYAEEINDLHLIRFKYNPIAQQFDFNSPLLIAENFGWQKSDQITVEQKTGAVYMWQYYGNGITTFDSRLVRMSVFLRWVNQPGVLVPLINQTYLAAPSIGAYPDGANMTETVTWVLSDSGANGTFYPKTLTWLAGEPALAKAFAYQPTQVGPLTILSSTTNNITFQFIPETVVPASRATGYGSSAYSLPIKRGIVVQFNQNGIFHLNKGDVVCGTVSLFPPLDGGRSSLTVQMNLAERGSFYYQNSQYLSPLNNDLVFSLNQSSIHFAVNWTRTSGIQRIIFSTVDVSYAPYDQLPPTIFSDQTNQGPTKCGLPYTPTSSSSSTGTTNPSLASSSSSSSSTGNNEGSITNGGSSISQLISLQLIPVWMIGMMAMLSIMNQ